MQMMMNRRPIVGIESVSDDFDGVLIAISKNGSKSFSLSRH